MEIDIIPHAGLCNRMRVIASAYACSLEWGREARVLWAYGNRECKARFHSLFQPVNLPSLRILDTNSLVYRTDTWRQLYLPGLLRRFKYEAVFENYNYKTEKSHLPLGEAYKSMSGVGKLAIVSMHQCGPNFPLKEIFKPVREIEERLEDVLPSSSEGIVGLHIRRTDHIQAIRHTPLENYISCISKEIDANPDIRFYLATDDDSVKHLLLSQFGKDRIITADSELRRDTEEGMIGAVVDLFALSRSKKIIGSFYSSYSEIASELGGGIELVIP